MHLRVARKWLTPISTIGELSIDGAPFCFTLEDLRRPDGAPKVYGETAIPPGVYNWSMTPSDRFRNKDGSKRLMPLIENVPGFSGVRIHWGNTAANTDGCLLVGEDRAPNFVTHSVATFDRLLPILQSAGRGTIEIAEEILEDTR